MLLPESLTVIVAILLVLNQGVAERCPR